MVAYLLTDYLLIATYGVLLGLVLRNIYVVLLKQKEYKNLPILMFYCFALIAITIRLIGVIWFWKPLPIIVNIDYVQQVAKLCVGVVQDWITLELAIRIHNCKGYRDISDKAKKRLRFARRILFVVTAFAFAAFCIVDILSAHREGNEGLAFGISEYNCLVYQILGYSFLC